MNIEALINKVKPYYETGDASHDLSHVNRVVNTCRKLGELENANMDVLMPAAVLHDVVNVPKNSPDRKKASLMAAEKAKELLEGFDVSEQNLNLICKAIEEHSYSRGLKPTSIEAGILQDADRLDALGAIGVMRTVTTGSRMGSSYYNVDEPFIRSRELDDRSFTLDHFYKKLLKLKDTMNTEAGRKEAERRTQFMNSFIAQLSSEIR